MGNISLRENISLLEKEMVRIHYKEVTLDGYRAEWSKFLSYCDNHCIGEYTEAAAMSYLDENYNFFTKEKEGTLKQSDISRLRMVRVIGEFKQHGAVLRRSSRSMSLTQKPENKEILDSFMLHLKSAGRAESTFQGYRKSADKLTSYLEAHSMSLDSLSAESLSEFTKTLLGYSPKTVEYIFCGVRLFLRYLFEEGIVAMDLSDKLPSVHTYRQTSIPSTWGADELKRMVFSIDRTNPSGKRDYAMIILAVNLGMRCIDIKHLKFDDIDWERKTITFRQRKTTDVIRLPLTDAAGWALIDYIKNGRPDYESDYVFLIHKPPYGPIADSNHMHRMLQKHIDRIGGIKAEHKRGMHSLRHSLATCLLEDGTSVYEISEILGHRDIDSTSVYLKASVGLLSECSINPEEYE